MSPRHAGDPPNAFAGFWQAGFEGADHVNGSARPLCMTDLTGHVRHAREDYRRLVERGIRTVRESAGWRECAHGGGFDFSSVGYRELCARQAGIQIAWTFFHYGVPDGLDLFDDAFVPRFADYCGALARYLAPFRRHGNAVGPPVYTPINEISFLTWAACETGLLHPHRGDRAHDGYALKQRMVRASIAGCEAIWAEEPDARILLVDPLIHVVPEDGEQDELARSHNEYQYQAWDMLCGRLEPQLGGHPRYLDLVGVNYYPYNQWLAVSRAPLRWPDDPRRRPLASLLLDVHRRYGRPIVLSETSHDGEERGAWLIDVALRASEARSAGARIDGICLYPAIDRPDWESPEHWHQSGLWRVNPNHLGRSLDQAYAQALAASRLIIDAAPPATATLTH
jgi:UDP-galactopyranose mutase